MFLDCFFCSVLSICLICHSFIPRQKIASNRKNHTRISLFFFSSLPNRAQFYLNTQWNGDKHVQKYMCIRHILLSLSITMDSIAIKTIRISHENSFKSVGHSKHNMHVIFFQGVFYALSIQSNALCHFCCMCKFMSIRFHLLWYLHINGSIGCIPFSFLFQCIDR